jgi:hypothetical protein
MRRVLVLGSSVARERLVVQLESLPDVEVVDCDPDLGDCVMYVRLEGVRYDAFFFVGWDHPVTRGALPIVAERSVLVPLVDQKSPDPAHDGYLFRLPKAIGYRDRSEREKVLQALPKASTVPSYTMGPDGADREALPALLDAATDGCWAWDEFVEGVRREVDERQAVRRHS